MARWGLSRALNLVGLVPPSEHEPRLYQSRILLRIAANAPANPRLVNVEFQAVAPAAMAPVLTRNKVAGSGVLVVMFSLGTVEPLREIAEVLLRGPNSVTPSKSRVSIELGMAVR